MGSAIYCIIPIVCACVCILSFQLNVTENCAINLESDNAWLLFHSAVLGLCISAYKLLKKIEIDAVSTFLLSLSLARCVNSAICVNVCVWCWMYLLWFMFVCLHFRSTISLLYWTCSNIRNIQRTLFPVCSALFWNSIHFCSILWCRNKISKKKSVGSFSYIENFSPVLQTGINI